MGVSSLGVGSSILTQDVLDQLRKADEGQRIRPITLNLANENDKKAALEVLDASMTNFRDSINEMKTATLYDERKATVSGSSVEVEASANSDIGDFTLDVTQLATKEINESGSYDSKTATIADAAGTFTLSIGDKDFDIEYDDTTTLDDLKKSINDIAGESVNATIVQIADGDFRLFLSSTETGADQNITIDDSADGNLKGTQLTDDMSTIQDAVDAEFKFNGETITRSSNQIDDLISGYDIKLKEVGSSEVKVEQNRDEIMKRVDSFVEKYNSIVTELGKQTKSSTESSERGIFSANSSIKSMKGTIQDMIYNTTGGVGSMADYGFNVDKDGKMSIDKDMFTQQLDDNPKNIEAFFSGGDFTKDDGDTVTLEGAFFEFYDVVNTYTKVNGNLDLVKENITDTISSLEDRKESATERLDAKYAIMKKQYAAYDLMINKLNSASSMFVQMANAQTASYN